MPILQYFILYEDEIGIIYGLLHYIMYVVLNIIKPLRGFIFVDLMLSPKFNPRRGFIILTNSIYYDDLESDSLKRPHP